MPCLLLKDTVEFPMEDLINIEFSRKIRQDLGKSENTNKEHCH